MLDALVDSFVDGAPVLGEHVAEIGGKTYLRCQQLRLTRAVSGAILISLCDRSGKELVGWAEPWEPTAGILTIDNIEVSMELEVT